MSNETKAQAWYMAGGDWTLHQTKPEPERSIYFETILSQANGHLGVRAYTEERSSETSLREGYLAGVFSHLGPQATKLAGLRGFPVSEMITIPEIFACELTLDGERFDPATGEVTGFERSLDFHSGELRRRLTWRSPAGRTTVLCFERFLSAARTALAYHRISVQPVDWQGTVTIAWEMNGILPTLVRFGAKSFPQIPQDHLRVVAHAVRDGAALLHIKTRGTEHDVAIAACVRGAAATTDFPEGTRLRQVVTLAGTRGTTATVERSVAVVSSRDRLVAGDAVTEAIAIATEAVAAGYQACLDASREVWAQRWARADVRVDGPARDQKVVRFNLFQLLQMAPWDSDRMSLAPRALSFNRYRGTYFWDTEIFILPFYSAVFPEVARNLLAFRYHTLVGARETALRHKAKGALYPWMVEADRGEDHSLFILTNVLWHQTADIAYAVDQYAQVSGDVAFMAEMGLEILAETARFWRSKMVFDDAGTGHIDGAMGPDETGAAGRDNGYTNLMAQRNLRLAVAWHDRLSQSHAPAMAALGGKIDLTAAEVADWRHAAERLNIPLVPDLNIPLQDGELLGKPVAPPEVMAFRNNPSAGDAPNTRAGYRVIKQADIVLAMLLLRDQFTLEEVAKGYDFYEPMTLHISSLSRNTHAIVAALLGRPDAAYDWFLESAAMDLDDFDHCTADGLHAAAIGGCWQGLLYGFAGFDVEAQGVRFRPHLPRQWRAITCTISHHGQPRIVTVDAAGKVTMRPPGAK